MVAFLMPLFIVLCALLVLIILIQPGKGDMGLGSLGRSGQQLFGGSGGQDFFEKATWAMGILFIVGALGLTMLRSGARSSLLAKYRVEKQETPANPAQAPATQK